MYSQIGISEQAHYRLLNKTTRSSSNKQKKKKPKPNQTTKPEKTQNQTNTHTTTLHVSEDSCSNSAVRVQDFYGPSV